jgi:hypothetical protein
MKNGYKRLASNEQECLIELKEIKILRNYQSIQSSQQDHLIEVKEPKKIPPWNNLPQPIYVTQIWSFLEEKDLENAMCANQNYSKMIIPLLINATSSRLRLQLNADINDIKEFSHTILFSLSSFSAVTGGLGLWTDLFSLVGGVPPAVLKIICYCSLSLAVPGYYASVRLLMSNITLPLNLMSALSKCCSPLFGKNKLKKIKRIEFFQPFVREEKLPAALEQPRRCCVPTTRSQI